ncbi:MAG: hypothetical protein JWP97_4464 [Labilithrix sp.]|nr:hypothetical protein [Labilithrix sp.]
MTRRLQRAVVAATAEVEAAADELLRKGNALDAVVAGVFAACAVSPGVLLGPVQILMGGGGSGLRALDGRVRQPGLGAPRPRGFRDNEPVPDAARVGVPWLPATLSAAIATAGASTFGAVMGPGMALSKGSARHEVLSKIQQRGPRGIEESLVSSELLAVVGRINGGLLTLEDLASPHPEVHMATRSVLGGEEAPVRRRRKVDDEDAEPSKERHVITLPWATLEAGLPVAPDAPIATARAVAAVDRNGSFAIAVWDESVDGVMVNELGLRAPFFAEPVRRGAQRVNPGVIRPASAPVALLTATDGALELAFAAFGAGDAYEVLGRAVRSVAENDQLEAHGEARLVALSHVQGTATAFR